MMKAIVTRKFEDKVYIDSAGNVLTCVFHVSKGMRTMQVEYLSKSYEVKVPSYKLEMEVYRVLGTSEDFLYSVNFGDTATRSLILGAFISKIARRDLLPSPNDIMAAVEKLRQQEEPAFQKEAMKLLKRDLGICGYSPFKRTMLEKKGLLEPRKKGDDLL